VNHGKLLLSKLLVFVTSIVDIKVNDG